MIDRFGVNENGWGKFTNFGAIALPLYVDRRLAGSLTMGFPRSAMKISQAIDRFGDKMRSEVERIEAMAARVSKNMTLPPTAPGKARPGGHLQ